MFPNHFHSINYVCVLLWRVHPRKILLCSARSNSVQQSGKSMGCTESSSAAAVLLSWVLREWWVACIWGLSETALTACWTTLITLYFDQQPSGQDVLTIMCLYGSYLFSFKSQIEIRLLPHVFHTGFISWDPSKLQLVTRLSPCLYWCIIQSAC